MIETINDLIATELWNLEEAQRRLVDLEKKWFKFGKDKLIRFLKIYIESKEEFIETLKNKLNEMNENGTTRERF